MTERAVTEWPGCDPELERVLGEREAVLKVSVNGRAHAAAAMRGGR